MNTRARCVRFAWTIPGPNPVGDSWMGWSVGHWEGNTLVVDVTGMNDQTWFGRAGDYHSNDLHVTERYTLKNVDVLNYEATIEDPPGFFAALENQRTTLSPPGEKLPAHGVQVRALRRTGVVWPVSAAVQNPLNERLASCARTVVSEGAMGLPTGSPAPNTESFSVAVFAALRAWPFAGRRRARVPG